MTNEAAINKLIHLVDTNEVSDGFHTFGELYEHRIILFMTLCRILYDYEPYNKMPIWMSKIHSDGTFWNDWFVLGIGTEDGKQITYHLPMAKFDECLGFAKELPKAPTFDGHSAAQVLERLTKLGL